MDNNVLLQTFGWIIAIIGWIWLVAMGFKHGIAWGLLNLLLPFVAFIFGIVHFSEAKTPFLIMVIGSILAGMGLIIF
jgi:hypothetical protein